MTDLEYEDRMETLIRAGLQAVDMQDEDTICAIVQELFSLLKVHGPYYRGRKLAIHDLLMGLSYDSSSFDSELCH